ncbi:MAG: DUF47 family protein [Candidatus Gastranaerophilaceae bacterium]|jgi:hypothetical protein
MPIRLLKKILPPQQKIFYTLFESSAEVCHKIAELFNDIIKEGISEERLKKAKELKHQSRDITKETLQLLNATFVTPIDREDIQELACLLNKIAKKIVKASFNLEVYKFETSTDLMKQQAETLIQATNELKNTIALIRKISSTRLISESNNKMKEIESKGDEILHVAMREIFSGKYDSLTVIKLKELYKNIESAMDVCSDISDLTVNIALKHS